MFLLEDNNEIYNIPKIRHKERVSKNAERLQYAIKQLEKHNVQYEVKNENTCHLHVWRKSDNKLLQFWVGTGKIQGYEERGIESLIRLLLL